MSRKRPIMAIIYDFDGTLAPGNIQEHRFLPDISIPKKKFWDEVKRIAKKEKADEVLVYMHLMIHEANNARTSFRKENFKKKGQEIKLFPGVEEWFERITDYGVERKVNIEHYLISSGNKEILEGTPIAGKFDFIYASEFMFDKNDVPYWPAQAVNYTTKTQYLFRINKGTLDLADNHTINKFIKKHKRRIPFENMIYIGDGETDIPCFRVVKEQGGISIAVFKPHTKGKKKEEINEYVKNGRVDYAVPTIYENGGDLDEIIKANIDAVAAQSNLSRLLHRKTP